MIELRALIAHPMETGHRLDSGGQRLPRDIVRRFEPAGRRAGVRRRSSPGDRRQPLPRFLAARTRGTLTFDWTGDNGFAHRERAHRAT